MSKYRKIALGVGVSLVVIAVALGVGLGIGLQSDETQSTGQSKGGWTCSNGQCYKAERNGEGGLPLSACRLTCDPNANIWPQPKNSVISSTTLRAVNHNEINLELSHPSRELSAAVEELKTIFKTNLNKLHPLYSESNPNPFEGDSKGDTLNIVLEIADPSMSLKLDTDESYTLKLSSYDGSFSAVIESKTYFGSRHGLETLSQLVVYNDISQELQTLSDVNVTDSPAFPHRGISLDTSRNFFSLTALKRTVDALSYNKLNVLHWHITDTHSYPLESVVYPQMTEYGAYSKEKVYYQEDVKELVKYALVRGVKVVPELDAPAHVGHGWEWGPSEGLGDMVVCLGYHPWYEQCVEPPCGQLNPLNSNIYDVLAQIYIEWLGLFDTHIFHMGGDEINEVCWESVPEIKNWYTTANTTFLDLWDLFQNTSFTRLQVANVKENPLDVILWSSELTNPEVIENFLNNDNYIVQVWDDMTTKGDTAAALVTKGYRVIFTNHDAWYLDCGYGAWVGEGNNWCSPYKGWQKVYMNNPLKILEDHGVDAATASSLVLGGEAALWTEQVDEQTLDGKLWPRGAALAERLWTDPQTEWTQAEARMVNHRQRMVQRGIAADRLQPEWCLQNEGRCIAPPPTTNLNINNGH